MIQKKYIIFGANGYIGRHLVNTLILDGHTVKAYDIQEFPIVEEALYLKNNLLDCDSLKLIDWDVDYVLFFSGITGTLSGFGDYQNFVQINEISLLNMLNSIKESSFRPRVVYPSSRLVYEGGEKLLDESSPKKTKTIYAVNKLASECFLDVYSNAFDIPYTIFRIGVPYGNSIGSGYSYGTIGFLLNSASDKGNISIYGDGSVRRTFTHVDDIVGQIIRACNNINSINNTFNIIGENYSIKDVALLISKKYNCAVNYNSWPDMDYRIESGSTAFNFDYLRKMIKYECVFSLDSWIDRL